MTNVLVLLPANHDHRTRLQAAAPDANFEYVEPSKVTDAQLSHADAILGNLAPERLPACENLRLLQLASAGFDKYVDGRVPRGAALCCSSGAYGQAVSEHLFAAVLCVMKRLDGYRDMQRPGTRRHAPRRQRARPGRGRHRHARGQALPRGRGVPHRRAHPRQRAAASL